MTVPAYRINGFKTASDHVVDDWFARTLAAHHTADEREIFLLFYDRPASWDLPGTAEYLGMHIERDPDQRTFTFDVTRQPTVPLTQNWLVTRGCPPEDIEPDGSLGPRPADALTSRLEDRLRYNPKGRYTLDDHTYNPRQS